MKILVTGSSDHLGEALVRTLRASEHQVIGADIEDIVSAHLLAMEKAPTLGFERFIISATSPFKRNHLPALRKNAWAVVADLYPDFAELYKSLGWTMFPSIDRVYVNEHARTRLGWNPFYDFASRLDGLNAGGEPFSALAKQVGSKGYHTEKFSEGPYPVE